MLPMILIALPLSVSSIQDTSAMDMTGMGTYAQEDAIEEAARDAPKRRARPSPTSRKPRESAADKRKMCAFANQHFAMLTPDQQRTVRKSCK